MCSDQTRRLEVHHGIVVEYTVLLVSKITHNFVSSSKVSSSVSEQIDDHQIGRDSPRKLPKAKFSPKNHKNSRNTPKRGVDMNRTHAGQHYPSLFRARWCREISAHPARPMRLRNRDLNPDGALCARGNFTEGGVGNTGRLGELGAVCGRGRFRRVVWGRADGVFEVGAGGVAAIKVGRTGDS